MQKNQKRHVIQMKDKIIFILISVSLLLIAGCGIGSGGKAPITDVDIRKGTEGLNMKFTSNAPPTSVFENTIFPIAINIKNQGAANIEKDEGILIFGFEKTFVDFTEKTKAELDSEDTIRFGLDGKSVTNPNGDEDFITLNAVAKKIGEQSDTRVSTILATACYPYNTTFGTSVCIDTDIYGIRKGQKACSISDLVFSAQGAPVAITKVITRMLPESDQNRVRPSFIITVENLGNGEVIFEDKVELACTSTALDYTDFNTLRLSASLSGADLDCKIGTQTEKSTTIRLREKTDTVICTLEEGPGIDTSRDAYVSPLRIELNYGYTFTISKNIIIEKILR